MGYIVDCAEMVTKLCATACDNLEDSSRCAKTNQRSRDRDLCVPLIVGQYFPPYIG